MNYPLVFAPGILMRDAAWEDVRATFNFMGQTNPIRARRFLEAAGLTFHTLLEMPNLGSPHPMSDVPLRGLRVWPVKNFKNYRVFYRPLASQDGIEIVRILHHSRDQEAHLSDPETLEE